MNVPTSIASTDVTCICAPVSDEPAESEITRLGRRSIAIARTAGVSGAPPLPTAKKDERS